MMLPASVFDDEVVFVDLETPQLVAVASEQCVVAGLEDEALGLAPSTVASAAPVSAVTSQRLGAGTQLTGGAKESAFPPPHLEDSPPPESSPNSGRSSCDSCAASMKVNQTPDDQLPLMFGSSGTRFGSKSRPTMISAKYRLKEERRKVLKISIGKLKKIEDPESSLRRSVLINNTVKRLQKEAREEKLLKQQVLYNSTSSCFLDDPDPVTTAVPTATTATSTMAEASVVSPLTTGVVDSLAPPASPTIVGTVTAVPSPAGIEPSPTPVGPVGGVSGSAPAPSPDSRKRPLLEDDCCDVLSQFYMPPTPRMLTSIDDEDEDDDVVVDVVDVEPPLPESPGSGASAVPAGDSAPSSATSPVDSSPAPPKRPKFQVAIEVPDPATAELERRLFSCGGDDLRNSTCCWSATSGVPRVPAPHSDDLRLRFADSSKPAPSVESSTLEQQQQQQQQQQQPQQYSCGHASIFGEIQSVVFHSLIASLES